MVAVVLVPELVALVVVVVVVVLLLLLLLLHCEVALAHLAVVIFLDFSFRLLQNRQPSQLFLLVFF